MSINITDRPSSSRNCTPKKFAKKKGGKAAKLETKVRKPVFKKKWETSKAQECKQKVFPLLGTWSLEEKLPKVPRRIKGEEELR